MCIMTALTNTYLNIQTFKKCEKKKRKIKAKVRKTSKHTHHTNSKVVIIEQFLLSLTQNLAKKIYSQKINYT